MQIYIKKQKNTLESGGGCRLSTGVFTPLGGVYTYHWSYILFTFPSFATTYQSTTRHKFMNLCLMSHATVLCLLTQFCEQDRRLHRLQLTDLLISPMQHCTKVPLLLNSIRRYTEDPYEQQMLIEALEKLEKSISL